MVPPFSSDSRKNLSFSEFLADNLREGTRLRIYHVSTPPTSTNPIYASPPNQPDVVTACESHFLGVSQELPGVCADSSLNDSNGNARRETANENSVLILGIEVLVFTTPSLTTIFVSKADSSGFRSSSSTPSRGSPSIIKVVTTAFLEWLVSQKLLSRSPEDNRLTTQDSAPLNTESEHNSPVNASQEKQPCPKLVVSLFARSQNQYLFPGSIENSAKHVLDDRQLIRWWCHILDTLAKKEWHPDAAALAPHSLGAAGPMSADALPGLQRSTSPRLKVAVQGHVIVPGCDRAEIIKSFLPPSARYAQPGQSRWHTSYPVEFLTGHRAPVDGTTLPVRCMIPRFPDDPKARYCDDLDGSGIDDRGGWRSVKTLQQFWETMEFRQECASGRLVGFIWVTFNPHDADADADADADLAKDSPVLEVDRQDSDVLHTATTPVVQGTTVVPVASETRNLASGASLRDTLVLPAEKYDILVDYLINETDFGGLSAAKQSTKEWIKKAEELSGMTDFGTLIEGRQAASEKSSVASSLNGASTGEKHSRDEAITPQVNILMGVRKKRKVDFQGEHDAIQFTNDPIASPSEANSTDRDRNGVTLLSAGLVRKKPKQ